MHSDAHKEIRVGLEKAEGQQRKAYALRIAPRALTPRVKAEVEVASVAWQSEERSNLSANPDQLGIDT